MLYKISPAGYKNNEFTVSPYYYLTFYHTASSLHRHFLPGNIKLELTVVIVIISVKSY